MYAVIIETDSQAQAVTRPDMLRAGGLAIMAQTIPATRRVRVIGPDARAVIDSTRPGRPDDRQGRWVVRLHLSAGEPLTMTTPNRQHAQDVATAHHDRHRGCYVSIDWRGPDGDTYTVCEIGRPAMTSVRRTA